MKSLSICIVGPTAVGKTGVAVEIAKLLDGEVIGLDSRQIYRHLAIGTAQPTEKEQQGIPHHLYGIRDPGNPISAGEYAHLVKEKLMKSKLVGIYPLSVVAADFTSGRLPREYLMKALPTCI